MGDKNQILNDLQKEDQSTKNSAARDIVKTLVATPIVFAALVLAYAIPVWIGIFPESWSHYILTFFISLLLMFGIGRIYDYIPPRT